MAGDHLCSVWMVATKVVSMSVMVRNGASVSVDFSGINFYFHHRRTFQFSIDYGTKGIILSHIN